MKDFEYTENIIYNDIYNEGLGELFNKIKSKFTDDKKEKKAIEFANSIKENINIDIDNIDFQKAYNDSVRFLKYLNDYFNIHINIPTKEQFEQFSEKYNQNPKIVLIRIARGENIISDLENPIEESFYNEGFLGNLKSDIGSIFFNSMASLFFVLSINGAIDFASVFPSVPSEYKALSGLAIVFIAQALSQKASDIATKIKNKKNVKTLKYKDYEKEDNKLDNEVENIFNKEISNND